MSERLVTTVKGETVPRGNCRRIDGNFYMIGDPRIKDSGDCYKIGDRYYRADTGYILFDEEEQTYVTSTSDLIKGFIDYKDGEFIEGYFSENILYNVDIQLSNGENRILFRKEIGEKNREYRFHRERGLFRHIRDFRATSFNAFPYLDPDYKYGLSYNCTDENMQFTIKAHNKSNVISKVVSEEQASLLEDITFGLEFETVSGRIKPDLCAPLGLIPLRDGSIGGLEYATIPLQGHKGLETINLICDKLSESTLYDENCSLHLHLGGLPRDKKHILAMFKMLMVLQDEMYSLFPIYKQYNFGVKRKNYTKPLPVVNILSKLDKKIDSSNLDTNFDTIFSFLSMGMPANSFGDGSGDLSQITSHPSDPRGTRKWNIRTRYHWVNMIPILFGNKKTVEFRLHTPTEDFHKISSYLYLCAAIILYVRKKCDDILAGVHYSNLGDIIYTAFSKDDNLAYRLNQYISNRKDAVYQTHSTGNIKGDEEEIRSTDIFKDGKIKSRGRRLGRTTDSSFYGSFFDAYMSTGMSDDQARAATQRRVSRMGDTIVVSDPFESM